MNNLYCRQYAVRSYILDVHGISIAVEHKRVKNINLAIYPPDGRVRVSAPVRCSRAEILAMIENRLGWIVAKQAALKAAVPVVESCLAAGEVISCFGRKHILHLQEKHAPPVVRCDGDRIIMQVRPGASHVERQKILENWLRRQLAQVMPGLVAKWAPVVGVDVREWRIRKMKTRWGTCNITDRRIWLNLELARLDPVFLEYVLVHEMVHLLERSHNRRYWGLMERFYPEWRQVRSRLKNMRI